MYTMYCYTPGMTQTEQRTLAPSGYLWGGPECGDLVAVAVEFENQYRNLFGYFEPSYGMAVSEYEIVPQAPLLADNAIRMTDPEYVRFVWTRLLPELPKPKGFDR